MIAPSPLSSNILGKWINPEYLSQDRISSLIESAKAKPDMRYLVLDNFFREEPLLEFVHHCCALTFSEKLDRRAGAELLPYDGAVKFADSSDIGWDLLNDVAWHSYCANLLGVQLRLAGAHVVKLRYHNPDATGFWIHSDATGERSIVVIAYFNRSWKVEYGGLLQFWREDEASACGVAEINHPNPTTPLRFLSGRRIRTRSPGGGFKTDPGRARDLVLIDQILPEYNRVVLCNLQTHPAWHSITPSCGRARYGFVQWMQ